MIDRARDELLLACVRGRWDPSALEEARSIVRENDVDWDSFCDQARKHAVSPLIHHTLKGDSGILSDWVKEDLQSAYYQSARRNTLLYQELGEIVSAFNEATLPVILLKGAALATGVYDNIALRPMADIDLLVVERDVSRAEELLLQRGYVIRDDGESHLRHATFTERSRGWPVHVEVHRHMVSSAYYRRTIPDEWLWQDPVEVTIGDASALRLSPQGAIFHACLHMLDHIAIKGVLLWLCDVVEVSRRHDIDWDALVDRMIQFKIVLPVRSILQESKELLGLPIPERILQRTFGYKPEFLEGKAYQSCLSPARSSTSKTFFDFISTEGLATRFRLLFSRLLPGRDYMMARYSIHNPRLVPLYYPYMIGRALFDGFRALARPGRG